MANLDFKSDLSFGQSGEDVVVRFLQADGYRFGTINHDNKYDIMMTMDDRKITFEVKTDFKCAPLFDTGNIFVEFESRNKPSGISVTQADWFVTYFLYFHELWFIKTSDLKTLIEENNFSKFCDAGDHGSATHGYLINRKEHRNKFNVFKIQKT